MYTETSSERGGLYAETTFMLPYLLSSNHVFQQFDDLSSSYSLKHNAALASIVSDYDLGAEGDLFKAPEPITEEPMDILYPMTPSLSMISPDLKVPDIGSSIDDEQLLSDVYYDCKRDILAKEATTGGPLSDILEVKFPLVELDENLISEGNVIFEGPFNRSVSSGCLSSMQTLGGPNFLDFEHMDMDAYGMRRAFSEGDIKTLGNGNINLISSMGTQPIIPSCTPEVRKEKLLRYRNKKTKRNFDRKIKYACRKTLADNQPRIRGRFAKTEETDIFKKN